MKYLSYPLRYLDLLKNLSVVFKLNVVDWYDEVHDKFDRVLNKCTVQTILTLHLNHQLRQKVPNEVFGNEHSFEV